jgi:hypothetical protein
MGGGGGGGGVGGGVKLVSCTVFHSKKQGLKTTYSSIVDLNQNNCRRKNCRTSHLLRKKIAPKNKLNRPRGDRERERKIDRKREGGGLKSGAEYI